MSKPSFFVSYAHTDKKRASQLRALITASGFECFLDRYDIEPGDPIDTRIMNAIRKCSHLLVVHSQASDKSFWVHYELGAAMALGRTVIEYVTHEAQSPFPTLHLIKHISSIPDFKKYLSLIGGKVDSERTTEPLAFSSIKSGLYHGRLGHVLALRLWGADDQFVPIDRVHVTYQHEPYIRPASLQEESQWFCRAKEVQCRASNIDFFDGPCARLLSWQAGTRDQQAAATEPVDMHLQLAPVSWYDYEGCNGARAADATMHHSAKFVEALVSLQRIFETGDISQNKLPNILDTATTVLTSDGYLAYTTRGPHITFSGKLTSAVAENINRYFDDTNDGDPTSLVHSKRSRYRSRLRRDRNYAPHGIPHPLAAALRGIEEELSPDLLKYIAPESLKVTGLCFDLGTFHPTLLLCVAVPLSAENIERLCLRHPGRDHRKEVRLSFVPSYEDNPIQELLALPNWLPGGQASLYRAYELISALRRDLEFDEAFDVLRA